jgi:hypothetical protein
MADVSNEAIASIPDAYHHRINLDESSSSIRSQSLTYQSTHDGDVLVVQPSFDDPGRRTPAESGDCQARSPPEVNKSIDFEQRNPSSPPGKTSVQAGHSRNLSSHFFDAASLKDKEDEYIISTTGSDGSDGRKHRRLFSSDISLPGQLHRRLDSQGGRGTVRRDGGFHHREDSAGLDLLSVVADASKEDLAAAVGAPLPSSAGPWAPSVPHQQEARPSPTEQFDPRQGYTMPPPSHASRLSQSSMSSYSLYGPPSHGQLYPPQQSQYSYLPPHHYQLPHSGSALVSTSRPYPHHPSDMPHPYAQDPANSWSNAQQPVQRGEARTQPTHQGSQTFVTAIAVGSGNVTLEPTKATKNAATNTAANDNTGIPSQIRHHRKMSSFSSIGTLMGSGLFSTPVDSERERRGHHRKTSSTISFLGDFPMGLESADAAFMKNLQASVNADVGDFPIPNPPKPRVLSSVSEGPISPLPVHPLKTSSEPTLDKGAAPAATTETADLQDDEEGSASWDDSSSKLASGGTSKRLRRKCTVGGCQNRVVQGGLCISHGAKRKTCKHPGCTKNVKKAGLCSTHGPARKRCDHEGCNKVAVQAGRCIAHGAKKKLCITNGCTKQAILAGMCKKHHDQSLARGAPSLPSDGRPMGEYCQVVKPTLASKPASHKAHHTRGLSIFAEISPDAVSTILNEGPPPTNPTAASTDRPAELW